MRYLSEACASGFAYPQGAPPHLAGQCADVEGAATTSGGSEMTTQAPTTSAGTSGEDVGSGPDSADDSTSAVATDDGGCSVVLGEVSVACDAFFAAGCPSDCESYNYGLTKAGSLRNDGRSRTLLALAFDRQELAALPLADIDAAELVLSGSGGGVTLDVGTIASD